MPNSSKSRQDGSNSIGDNDDFDSNLLGVNNPFGSKEFQKTLDHKTSRNKKEPVNMINFLNDMAAISKRAAHPGIPPESGKLLAETVHILAISYSMVKEIEFVDSQMVLPGEMPMPGGAPSGKSQ